jgi:hypothetical protein
MLEQLALRKTGFSPRGQLPGNPATRRNPGLKRTKMDAILKSSIRKQSKIENKTSLENLGLLVY